LKRAGADEPVFFDPCREWNAANQLSVVKRSFPEDRVPTPATYKEYAADCLAAMRAAMLPEVRALLLAMAQRWNEFAERAEQRTASTSSVTDRM
jgi:hypothetical protein